MRTEEISTRCLDLMPTFTVVARTVRVVEGSAFEELMSERTTI